MPTPVVPEPVAKRPGVVMRVHHEREVPLDQSALFGRRVRLAAEYDQHSGRVVGAVAVDTPGYRTPGVLQQPHVVGQPQQMVERERYGAAHAPAAFRRSASARSRYRSATAGQRNAGATRAALAIIPAAHAGWVRTWRR